MPSAGLSWVLAALGAIPLTVALDGLIGALGFHAPLPFVLAGGPIAIWAAWLALVELIATLLQAMRASRITVREALAHL